MSAALPHATDEQAARAIAHVECVLSAAKAANQHNENMIVLMDRATAMFQRLQHFELVLGEIEVIAASEADEATDTHVAIILRGIAQHAKDALSKAKGW